MSTATLEAPIATPAVLGATTTPVAPVVAAAPAPVNALGTWRESLPGDLATSPSLAKFNDMPALAKSYLELEKKVSVPQVQLPNESWGDKEYGDFYAKIGRPAKPEEYGFKPVENLPAGVTYDAKQDEWFAKTALETGLTTRQATKLREEHLKLQAGVAETHAQAAIQRQAEEEKNLQSFKSEFGDKWDSSIDGARKVAAALGGDDMESYLVSKGLHKDPKILKLLINVAKEFGDHRIIQGKPNLSGNFGNMGPAAAEAELTKMKADPVAMGILSDASHPQRAAVHQKWSMLHQQAHPVQK